MKKTTKTRIAGTAMGALAVLGFGGYVAEQFNSKSPPLAAGVAATFNVQLVDVQRCHTEPHPDWRKWETRAPLVKPGPAYPGSQPAWCRDQQTQANVTECHVEYSATDNPHLTARNLLPGPARPGTNDQAHPDFIPCPQKWPAQTSFFWTP